MPRIVPPAPAPPNLADIVEEWVTRYGESVTQTRAAKILGCDQSTVSRLIKAGTLPATPLKAVLVRPLAEWAYRDYCTNEAAKKKLRIV